MAVASATRVCIKNLPLNTTEDDLKEFLVESSKQKLEITDCKVLKNAKGKSRKVAFVGFRHEDQASFVVETFDKSFLRMSRLSVEAALPKKNETDPATVPAAVPTREKSKNEASTKEHFTVTQAGKKASKFWGNDEEGILPVPVPVKEDGKSVASSSSEDSSSSSSSSSSETSKTEDDMAVDAAADKAKEKTPVISDMDFLRSKQGGADELAEGDNHESSSSSSSESDDSDDSASNADNDETTVEKKKEPQVQQDVEQGNKKQEVEVDSDDDLVDANKDEVSQSRLFVRNLPFGTAEEELADYFSSFGKVTECHIPMDDQMKNNKGFAFVAFVSAADAFAARTQLDKKDFQGRLLHILPARPPLSAPKSDDPNLTWKQRQELDRKEKETKSGEAAQGWSASFVRGDTVVDNLADKLGLRKGEILGVKDKLSSGDAAVRLALGETQIIEENRQYFKEYGVDMDALVSGDGKDSKRSKTSILVKNLPYDTRVEELTKLFQVGEESMEVLLPPSRSIALVKYGHSADAKRAFRRLAYRRFKHVPIYLEWAPLAADTEPSDRTSGSTPPQTTTPSKEQEETENTEEGDEDEATSGASSTIYIKNLNFVTTEETLRSIFEKNIDGVRSVRIPRKLAPLRNQEQEAKSLSMGFGFVELSSQSEAEKAIKKLNGKTVDGHAWELTISASKSQSQSKTPSKTGGKNPTKLIVRNVPFQATRTELLKLFGTFGQLRKVRLPKKFDGSHRGFAFVEFLTSKEAQTAMTSLSRTHLYGRHLVLEWATKDDQSVDMLREKAKRDTISISAQPQNKRIKFEDFDE
jgi:multiple RNA-binding domain-containing protein 1